MKKLVAAYNNSNLVVRILIGIIIGALLGLWAPSWSVLSLLGNLFVGALRAIAPVLVFVLVVSALANAKGTVGKEFRTVIGLYVLSTFLAAVVAVVASYIFPVTVTLAGATEAEAAAPQNIGEVLQSLLMNMVANPIQALSEGNYLGILAWSAMFGVALKAFANQQTKDAFSQIADSVTQVVRWIINLAPFGIMGLVFTSVSESGLAIFTDYGSLLAILVGCMLTVLFVVEPLIIFICIRKNPYPLVFMCLKESGIPAFFTRSSAANIPINMALCEHLGLNKDIYSVSIPLGATINMDGAAVTISVMTLCAAHTVGITPDFGSALLLSILAALAACGASGVAGGSLLLIPMACSLFNISSDIAMQMVGIGFIIGVVQDSFETMINSSGDVMFAATAEFMQWRREGKPITFGKEKKLKDLQNPEHNLTDKL